MDPTSLTPERHQKARALFDAAQTADPAEQRRLLAAAEPEVRLAVEKWLGITDPGLATGQAAEALGATTILMDPTHSGSAGLGTGTARKRVPAVDAPPVLPERYRLGPLLGEGGMGAVYQATDLEVRKEIAIKVIRNSSTADQLTLDRFMRELRLSQAVTHKNVVRIYDLVVHGQLRFITMELVRGQTLAKMMRPGERFTAETAAPILQQVALALEAAHAAEVVHRDLKPQNIMVTPEGVVKVMDFGIARPMHHDVAAEGPADLTANPTLTQAGSFIGTPQYVSPEQLLMVKLDGRADIYTLGVIAYEMLAGRNPHGDTASMSALMKRTKEPVPPLAVEELPGLNAAFAGIVMRCLERLPENRYQTATELVQALTLYMAPLRAERAFSRRTLVGAGLGAVATLGTGLYLRQPLERWLKPAPLSIVNLLVGDFENRTGDEYLNGTLETQLVVEMERASFINFFSRTEARRRIEKQLAGKTVLDEEACLLLARRDALFSAATVGTVEKAGDGYRWSIRLLNAGDGRAIGPPVQIETGARLELLSSAREVAAKLRGALGEKRPENDAAKAETFTASSVEAAFHYAQGQDLALQGNWDRAIEEYERALKLDPKLGRAFSGLAVAHRNANRSGEAVRYYDLALSNLDRMNERERFRTRGGYFMTTHDYGNAAKQFTDLAQQFPADTGGHSNLALALLFLRKPKEALVEGQKAADLYPSNVTHQNNVALYALYAGEFDRAVAQGKFVKEKLNPQLAKAYLAIGMGELARGRAPEAQSIYRELAGLSSWGASTAVIAGADLLFWQGQVNQGLNVLRAGIAADDAQGQPALADIKRAMVAELLAGLGRKAEGAQESRRALRTRDLRVQVPAALALANCQEPVAARAVGVEVGKGLTPAHQAYAALIEAEILLRSGAGADAVAAYQRSLERLDLWPTRLLLGRAYVELGAFAQASKELDECMKRIGEATSVYFDDLPTLHLMPLPHYWLGRASEGLKSADARDHYQRFVGRAPTETDDPLILDARARLNRGLS